MRFGDFGSPKRFSGAIFWGIKGMQRGPGKLAKVGDIWWASANRNSLALRVAPRGSAMARPKGRPKGSKSNPNRKPLPFKQNWIERAIRGVEAGGLSVHSVEIDPQTGKITIGTALSDAMADPKTNPWDKKQKGKKDAED
jgi:hypothetical protein